MKTTTRNNILTGLGIVSSLMFLYILFGFSFTPEYDIANRILISFGYIMLISVASLLAQYAIKGLIQLINGVHNSKGKDIAFGIMKIVFLSPTAIVLAGISINLIMLIHYHSAFSDIREMTLTLFLINTIEMFISTSKEKTVESVQNNIQQPQTIHVSSAQGYYNPQQPSISQGYVQQQPHQNYIQYQQPQTIHNPQQPQGYVQQQPQQVYYNPQQGGQPTQSYQHPQIPQGYNPYWRQTGSQRQPVYPQSVPMQGNVQYPNNPQQPPQK